jgi:hypothetical protein
MTIEEVERQIATLERHLIDLKWEVMRLKGYDVIPGFGPVGTFRDDPTFDEFVQCMREDRAEDLARVIEELDREERMANDHRAGGTDRDADRGWNGVG